MRLACPFVVLLLQYRSILCLQISGNIIKDNDELQRTNTLLYIYIYIYHTLILKGLIFLWCVRDGWRGVNSEWGLLFPISSSRSQGLPTLAPSCKLVRDASGRLRAPRSTVILCTLSINLTAWLSSRDLFPVTHLFDLGALIMLSCLLIKMWQLAKHTVSLGTNRKIHGICYITQRIVLKILGLIFVEPDIDIK